jgi:hypothetical protein
VYKLYTPYLVIFLFFLAIATNREKDNTIEAVQQKLNERGLACTVTHLEGKQRVLGQAGGVYAARCLNGGLVRVQLEPGMEVRVLQ